MSKQKVVTAFAAAITLSVVTAAPIATTAMAQQNPQQVYGSQLMTQQERLEYRQRLQNAKTVEERERIRAEHHRSLQERAREQGVTLPERPPVQGMHQGSRMGFGPGKGQGGGRGRGGG